MSASFVHARSQEDAKNISKIGLSQEIPPVIPCSETIADDLKLESEKQLQLLLKKQLDTNLTKDLQLKQRKTFTEASVYQSLTRKLAGKLTSEEYRVVLNEEKCRESLHFNGLTEGEIQLKLENDEQFLPASKKRRYGLDPDSLQSQLQNISQKIAAKQKELEEPDTFSGMKYMTRQNMELEAALDPCTKRSHLLSKLLTTHKKVDKFEKLCNPWTKLPEIAKEMMERLEKKSESISNSICQPHEKGEQILDQSTFSKKQGHIVTHSNIQLIDKEDILKNKLSVDEIRKIKKFENYVPGEPNNVLFLKNLSKKVEESDLIALFGQFQRSEKNKLVFQMLKGNMKGQAFITFPDIPTAKSALDAINGYQCKGKPFIIQFAHSKKC